jgi:hypothetical protein
LSDETQRTASLGERGCENLDNSTTAYCIVRIFPLSNLWLRHALLARQGSWSTREDDDEKYMGVTQLPYVIPARWACCLIDIYQSMRTGFFIKNHS